MAIYKVRYVSAVVVSSGVNVSRGQRYKVFFEGANSGTRDILSDDEVMEEGIGIIIEFGKWRGT